MHPWHDVSPQVEGAPLTQAFRAVIEIPKGSTNKYELDKPTGLLKLDRVLSSAVYYPANYGFIPQTLAEDDDPLDVLVYCSEDIPPLTLCEARPLGVMTMRDRGDPDHKLIAVLRGDPMYGEYHSVQDFPDHMLRILRRFFKDYKALEGKEVKVGTIQPARTANAILKDALSRYQQSQDNKPF